MGSGSSGDDEEQVLGIADVAALLGVAPATIRQYLSESRDLVSGGKRRGRYTDHPFPEPNGRVGNSPWWSKDRTAEIREWEAARPGQGAGGGRPRKTATNEPSRRHRPARPGRP